MLIYLDNSDLIIRFEYKKKSLELFADIFGTKVEHSKVNLTCQDGSYSSYIVNAFRWFNVSRWKNRYFGISRLKYF